MRTGAAHHSIFISYRRDDAGGWPGRVEADLADHFGSHRVFRDVGIPAGVDYEEHIERVLDGCSVLIAVIGPSWMTLRGPDGTARLLQPDDLLREELERALRRPDVTVIPVLVAGAEMPAAADLPPSLQALARRQATTLTDRGWAHDVGILVERIYGLLGQTPPRAGGRASRGRALMLAIVATVAAVAAGMFALRDGLFPSESARAAASVVDYQRSVGAICAEIDRNDRAGTKDDRRMRRRLRAARSLPAQRNAMLDAVRSRSSRSADELAGFRSLKIPPSMARRHRATLARWDANHARVEVYEAKLDGAGDASRLAMAIQYLASIRRELERDRVELRAGLLGLGGGQCVLRPPVELDTITLPRLPRARSKHRSIAPAPVYRPVQPAGVAPAVERPDYGVKASPPPSPLDAPRSRDVRPPGERVVPPFARTDPSG